MSGKFLKIAAVTAVAAVSLVSCGNVVSVVSDDNTSYPENSTENTAPVTAGITEGTTGNVVTEPVTEQFTLDVSVPDNAELSDSYIIEGFEAVMQEPELPTGCEVTALTEVVCYLGFDVDKVTMSDDFMPIDYNGEVTMKDAYIGDPKANNGFGCNAPVIVQTADKYFASIDSPCYAEDITGSEVEELFWQITQGRPVVVWVTMGMRESYPKYEFTAQNGEEMWFNSYQHCIAIYGYDVNEGIVYAADPLAGNTTYSISQFALIYKIMGLQAVVICGDSSTKGHHVTTEAERSVVMMTATERRAAEEVNTVD